MKLYNSLLLTKPKKVSIPKAHSPLSFAHPQPLPVHCTSFTLANYANGQNLNVHAFLDYLSSQLTPGSAHLWGYQLGLQTTSQTFPLYFLL